MNWASFKMHLRFYGKKMPQITNSSCRGCSLIHELGSNPVAFTNQKIIIILYQISFVSVCVVAGIYACSQCGYELFNSASKFEHSSPWPAFTETIHADSVSRQPESETVIKVTTPFIFVKVYYKGNFKKTHPTITSLWFVCSLYLILNAHSTVDVISGRKTNLMTTTSIIRIHCL